MTESTKSILIFGDLMVDTFLYGDVSRISPEAPVPVLKPNHRFHYLGGAANVARNTSALAARTSIVGVCGDDENASVMQEEFERQDIDSTAICRLPQQRTIHKMRLVGNDQQLIRIDWHDSYAVDDEIEKMLLASIDEVLSDQDIVIISDYGKGTCSQFLCQQIIKKSQSLGIPVIVDPKGKDWSKYSGATIITPNLKEISEYAGISVENDSEFLVRTFKNLPSELGIDYLLLTRSECGMSLIGHDKEFHVSSKVYDVYDVSGAGDTAVAALASKLDRDLNNIDEAIAIANIAAGLVVAKPGTATVSQAEIEMNRPSFGNKNIFSIQDYDDLDSLLNNWRKREEKIVTTNGCFDVLHSGHLALLEKARSVGEHIVVLLNSDQSVKKLKGNDRPINNELDRANVLASLQVVDAVVIFDPEVSIFDPSQDELELLKSFSDYQNAPMCIMKRIRPDVHFKGGDYDINEIPESIFALEVDLAPELVGYSTTSIVKKILTASKN